MYTVWKRGVWRGVGGYGVCGVLRVYVGCLCVYMGYGEGCGCVHSCVECCLESKKVKNHCARYTWLQLGKKSSYGKRLNTFKTIWFPRVVSQRSTLTFLLEICIFDCQFQAQIWKPWRVSNTTGWKTEGRSSIKKVS